MGGLSKICKQYGKVTVTGADGKKVEWLYDYVKDKPRIKEEMTADEIMASEKKKWKDIKENINSNTNEHEKGTSF